MPVIVARDVFDGVLKHRVRDHPPFLAIVELSIVLPDSSLLVETGFTHGDLILILVERFLAGV